MTESPVREEDRSALTRRQLLAALGVGTLAAAGHGYGPGLAGRLEAPGPTADDHPAAPFHVATLTALAAAVYPSSVSVDESFVENAILGRVEPEPGHFDELIASIEAVDEYARARFGGPITDLPPATRRAVLQSMGVTAVHPTRDGTTAERVRFYLVNDLLYGLFTSPVSSDLTGIDNPPGHPGGLTAYQRGPGDDR